MMYLQKEFTFDAAHKLENYDGKCARLHGHTYQLHVVIQGYVDNNGFVMDFGDIKQIVKTHVIDILDHTYLNDTIKQPTAENITFWIWDTLAPFIPLSEVRLWESPTLAAIYKGEKRKKGKKA